MQWVNSTLPCVGRFWAGTEILTVQAADNDDPKTDNVRIFYRLVGQIPESPRALFRVDRDSGVISVQADSMEGTAPQYTLTITAEDAKGEKGSMQKSALDFHFDLFCKSKKKVLLIIYFVYIDITLHLFPLSDGPFNQWANTAVDKFNISCALASLARLSPNNWIRALKKCEWMNDKRHALVEPSEKILSSLLLCEITEMRSRNTKINTLVNSSPLLKQRCLQY